MSQKENKKKYLEEYRVTLRIFESVFSYLLSDSYNGTLFKSLRGVYVIISFFSYTVPTTTVQTAKFMDIASSPQAYTVKTTFTGGFPLKKYMEERVIESATYIIEHNATVRQTAKQFGVSKSTVHKDVTERLETINKTLARQARKVLDINKSERHIRGGMATKEKYLHNK